MCSGNWEGHNRDAASEFTGKQTFECNCRIRTESTQRLVQNREVGMDGRGQAAGALTS